MIDVGKFVYVTTPIIIVIYFNHIYAFKVLYHYNTGWDSCTAPTSDIDAFVQCLHVYELLLQRNATLLNK